MTTPAPAAAPGAPAPAPGVACAAGCKREAPADQLSALGWEFLPISRRWRCGQCWRELQEVNRKDTT